MEEYKIPPRTEWKDLSVMQLYELKTNMMNRYYSLRSINASFAEQYVKFLQEIDALILSRETAAQE